MNGKNYFWVGYSDLLTSLFFVMLVLFAISLSYLNGLLNATEEQLAVYKEVESSLDKLKSSEIFRYDKEYKRYNLDFEVQYKEKGDHISSIDLENYGKTVKNLDSVAKELRVVVDNLAFLKTNNPRFKNVSYLVVVTGYASKTSKNDDFNYILSYKRAYFLYKYWKNQLNIDFDTPKYHNIVEFQIAGMGFGGIGRFPYVGKRKVNGKWVAGNPKNQRFIINIIPKIGEIENTKNID